MGLAADFQGIAGRIFRLGGNLIDLCCQFFYRTGLFYRSLAQRLGAGGKLTAGGAVYLTDDMAQFQLHIAHGDQDIPKTSHIHFLMLGADIQILAGKLGQQIIDIIEHGT